MVKDITKADYELKNIYFPALKHDNFYRTTSNQTDRYNCIAWAMRLTDRWVQPSRGAAIWWPRFHKVANFDTSTDGLIRAFNYLGFVKCTDHKKEFFYDKVALYFESRSGEWTHAARVLSEKEYHSKAGRGWDFHHDSLGNRLYNVDVNLSYGEVYQIMKRHKVLRIYSYLLMVLRLFQKIFSTLWFYLCQASNDIRNLWDY